MYPESVRQATWHRLNHPITSPTHSHFKTFLRHSQRCPPSHKLFPNSHLPSPLTFCLQPAPRAVLAPWLHQTLFLPVCLLAISQIKKKCLFLGLCTMVCLPQEIITSMNVGRESVPFCTLYPEQSVVHSKRQQMFGGE